MTVQFVRFIFLAASLLIRKVNAVRGTFVGEAIPDFLLHKERGLQVKKKKKKPKQKRKKAKCKAFPKDTEGEEFFDLVNCVPTMSPFPTATPYPTITDSPTSTDYPTSSEMDDACEVASVGGVYETERSFTISYVYELLTFSNQLAWPFEDVLSNVDTSVQKFLLDELVDCGPDRRLSRRLSAVGVGPGEPEQVTSEDCTSLVPTTDASQAKVCKVVQGSSVLYLTETSDLTYEDASLQVFETLSEAFNGEGNIFQERFVDEENGILGLHFVRGILVADGDETTGVPTSDVPAPVDKGVAASDESLSGGAIFGIVVAGAVGLLLVALAVFGLSKRSRSDTRSAKSSGKFDDPMEVGILDDPQVSQTITCDSEEDDSGEALDDSGDVLDNSKVFKMFQELDGITQNVSLSEDTFEPPTFVKLQSPNIVTPRHYQERSYSVEDTVNF